MGTRMKHKIVFTIDVIYDEEAKVWVATSEDIPGLCTEAKSFEKLTKRVEEVAPELLELNNVITAHEIPLAYQQDHYRMLRVS